MKAKFSIFSFLYTLLITFFYVASAYCFEKGLVLYLRFDEGKGDIAYDISGKENHGNINKTVWVKEGKFGSALSFNGDTESYVRIKKSESLVPDNQVTLEAWVFPTKVEGFNNIIANTEASGHNIRFENKKLISYIHIAGAYLTPTGGPEIIPEKWYHTAVSYDGKTAKLYLNGELIGQADRSGKITESSQDIFIGSETDANQPNPTYMFFGIIDEVRIWHIARTQEEIRKGMEKPLAIDLKKNISVCWGEIKRK